jgi:peptidoglycan hydrolase CwlO-like protein
MSDQAKLPLTVILENQEDRIQHLERERVEVATQMSKQTTILESVKEEIGELTNSVKETNKSMAEFASKVVDEQGKIKGRVVALEKRDRAEVEKVKWHRKLIYAIVIGGGGGVLTFIAERLVNHLGM